MPRSVLDPDDIGTSKYIITHVFCPLRLPDGDDHNAHNDYSLARSIAAAARLYCDHIGQTDIHLWHSIVRVLEYLQTVVQSESMNAFQTISQFSSMGVGDVLALLIRAQNAGVVFRKQEDVTIFESFEISPRAKDVMIARGKLICSYPGPAIEIPNNVFNDADFLSELSNFLVHMDHDDLDVAQQPPSFEDTAHPRFITELLTGILRSVGRPADVPRISKRMGDDVVWNNMILLPWRRSSLWTLIRVTLQTTLDRSPLGHGTYKEFMLFFMCCLAEENTCADLPSDLLHFMSAKISRRLRKFGSSAPDWLSCTALEACGSLQSTIENRWKRVQAAQRASPLWAPSQLDPFRDIRLSLLVSKDYLRNALANRHIRPPDVSFNPVHPPRGILDDFLSSDWGFFEEAYRVEPYVTLYDFERAVEQGIDAWVDRVTNNDEACVKLEVSAYKYSSSALKTYAGNPELLSIMLLTTVELWIALDKITVKEIPILADYSPEVPASLLERLLLCKATNLHRVPRAHEYLSRRHSKSRYHRQGYNSRNQWSVFSSTATADSFAVRFYRRSSHLQRLKTQIEEVARRQVREKIAEMREMNDRYAKLRKREIEAGPMDSVDMLICVHEWPLPAKQLEAEVVVFELDCPVSFNMWRAATLHLLVDLCSPSAWRDISHSRLPVGDHYTLGDYHPLHPYLVGHPRSRVTLVSRTKPFAILHPTIRIPAKQEQVCIGNGLAFVEFDTHAGTPVSQALAYQSDGRGCCTYKLPGGPYQNLQKYVDSTSHTSNAVVAGLADCHEDLSVQEYMAFGHLRSGGLLQWLNILRELRGRSLSFRRHEIYMLLAQAACQVGPLADIGLAWHQEIQQPTFCFALLGEIRDTILSISASWLEGVTMDTASLLLRRLLASSPDEAISLEVVDLLRTMRRSVFSWVQELSAELATAPMDQRLRGVLRDTAAICRSTFDVDPITVPKLLHSSEDVEVLLSSAMLIHLHMPSETSHLSAYSQLLLDRDFRLSLALENVVSRVVQADFHDKGVNLAVSRIWPGYRPGSRWRPLQAPNSRWISCTTASLPHQRPQVVHLNILNGSLLINGKPSGTWLPNKLVRHPLYKLIFGEQVLEVIPGGLPGMDYSTKGLISNHQVYFSLRNNDSDLVIRAKRMRAVTGGLEITELIPRERLKGDLPAVLLEGHVRWLNLSTSIMEIRPLDTLWEASSNNWRVFCIPGHYRMQKGHEFLDLIVSVSVDSSKPTSSSQLSVILPRYGLSFYVDEDGELQSRNMQGMVYDENQSVGTLFGLVNQLVLRPKTRNVNAVELVPRCILIPDGDVSFRAEGHHVRVEITTRASGPERITYQIYRVNTDLGCLTGNANLTSRLYCAYLHALTSGCSVDPLTGRSGTEEALSTLRSASCWSSVRFGSRDAELLSLIASTSPSPRWYPNHSIQMMEWLDLPASSHYHELFVLSKAIKERQERVQLFHEGESAPSFQHFPLQDDHLLKRSVQRAAYLFPSEFSVQPSDANSDVRYSARDLAGPASGEGRAHTAATCVYRRTAANIKDVWKFVESWTEDVIGDAALSLEYDRSWLAPDLPLIWLKAYNLLRGSDERKWFQLLFSLPSMAYASSRLLHLVPMFVAFASHSEFRFEDPPHYDAYPVSKGCYPSFSFLHKCVSECAYTTAHSSDWSERVQELLAAWPCETPPPCSLDPGLYDVAKFTSEVEGHFSDCFRNLKLQEHLIRVQKILDNLRSLASRAPDTSPYSFHPWQPEHDPPCGSWQLKTDQLFTRPAPPLRADDLRLPQYHDTTGIGNASLPDSMSLHQLITTIGVKAANPFQHRYVSALRISAEHFENEMLHVGHGTTMLPTSEILVEHYVRNRAACVETLHLLQKHLGPRSESEQAVARAGLWPRITVHTLFGCLASNSQVVLPDDWRRALTRFALIMLDLQRARRLLLLRLNDHHEELLRELENEACDGWKAETHPDWLLIQLQGNFLIRGVQAEVAGEMISPRSGDNTTMQLNMGEGKTSVIVPIVAVVLANGDQLVRVIVPKPLTAQTLHLLADRLGGLVNRRIYYLPFSRSQEITSQKVASLHQILLECMEERGILDLQPEHVLSLKLVCVEKQLAQEKEDQLAHLLLELEQWLHSRSRDILDESDEILDVRSQLVFAIGPQQHMEGSPERWTIIQQVLGLVNRHASSLQELFPFGVEYEPGPPGSFPHLRVLQAEAGQELVSWIARDAIDGLIPNINFGHLHSDLQVDVIRNFILCEDVQPTHVQLMKECFAPSLWWGGLLLLRGLLADGILLFALKGRRWRVDYGLSPSRTMLAVPYRAKDVPAQRAEFGHPDVAIILTTLSYYYDGLSEEQLRISFGILFKQHNSSSDYELWVRTCSTLPEPLRTLSGVNVESMEQWNKFLFPLFSRNLATISFYLSNVVFPREARGYPWKLSSSSWDLAEKKGCLLTGFSGTNDSQYLLPLQIAQHDPDHQRGTNAKVLSYLLQPENKHYMCVTHQNGKRRNVREFLHILVAQKPEIRVLLDVGAQMLDLQNYELARMWLDFKQDASAAIYFNEDDELMVCTRDGNTEPLRSSPFEQQLDRCVAYLDDAHTRGTDIKFPSGFRAAVTLGPSVTKDRLTQGCMRMRKLGHGHSIMFFAPLEVDRRVRSVAGKDDLDLIETMDILHWTVRETWENIQRWAPHWVEQGMDHVLRHTAWTSFCEGELTSEVLSEQWLQPEAKRLEDLYAPRSPSDSAESLTNADIRQRCANLGIRSLRSVAMDEEQERELVYELRLEQQVGQPVSLRAEPASHSLHPDVVEFVKTGAIPRSIFFRARSKAFRPAFDTLDSTSAVTSEAYIWSQSVLATADFEETVKVSGKKDDYLRPVHWIVSAKREFNDVLVILSPHEVNCLLPDIRSSKKVHLHLYTPRVAKLMKPCDDLALYSIPAVPDGWSPPSSFMDQLGLFAGQLYLKDYETYTRLCRFLCVYTRDLQGAEGIQVERDGFILPRNRPRLPETGMAHTFSSSPITPLKALMDLRRRGLDFASTHVGRLLCGRLLSEDDFDG